MLLLLDQAAKKMAAKEYTDNEICLKCIDENEILFDEDEKYLRKVKCSDLECPEHFYEEILRNLTQCKDVLFMTLKQRIITNESRVRFYAKNDISGMQAKISDIILSKECKEYLANISEEGYTILKGLKFLEHFVEFDAVRYAKARIFGQDVNIEGHTDMISLTEDSQAPTVIRSLQTKTTPTSKYRRHKTSGAASNNSKNYSNDEDIDDLSELESRSEATVSSTSLGRAVTTVVITARNYVSAMDIFRQFVFLYLHSVSRFFFLVYHVGPLVEKQQIVLYEYKLPTELVSFVKLYKKANKKLTNSPGNIDNTGDVTKPEEEKEFIVSLTVQKSSFLGSANISLSESHDLDLSLLEAEFRKVKGHYIQQVAPLREYFRYMVYDCAGVKDHQKDKKSRYERYMAKKEMKREMKKKKTMENKEQEGTQEICDSINPDMGSSCIHISSNQ